MPINNKTMGPWTRTIWLAGSLCLAGCFNPHVPQSPEPSLAFLVDCRVAFEKSLETGDLDGAEAALTRLGSRNVEDTSRWLQLGLARRIQALFEEGWHQIAAGECQDLALTLDRLGGLREEIYRGEFEWPVEYAKKIEKDYLRFRLEAGSVLGKSRKTDLDASHEADSNN